MMRCIYSNDLSGNYICGSAFGILELDGEDFEIEHTDGADGQIFHICLDS